MHSSRTAHAVVEQGPVLARQEGPGSNGYGRIAQVCTDKLHFVLVLFCSLLQFLIPASAISRCPPVHPL